MKSLIFEHNTINLKETKLVKMLNSYVVYPLKFGLYGFASFFTVLIVIKALMYLTGSEKLFVINLDDVLLSFLGFVSLFVVRIIQNLKRVV